MPLGGDRVTANGRPIRICPSLVSPRSPHATNMKRDRLTEDSAQNGSVAVTLHTLFCPDSAQVPARWLIHVGFL